MGGVWQLVDPEFNAGESAADGADIAVGLNEWTHDAHDGDE